MKRLIRKRFSDIKKSKKRLFTKYVYETKRRKEIKKIKEKRLEFEGSKKSKRGAICDRLKEMNEEHRTFTRRVGPSFFGPSHFGKSTMVTGNLDPFLIRSYC